MNTFLTLSGQKIRVIREHRLGWGGEGEVLTVAGSPGLVAKILRTPTPERHEKLYFMVSNPPAQSNSRPWVAWPTDLLFTIGTTKRKPTFTGYLMPRISGALPLFLLYNPTMRRIHLPGLDYRYLLRCGHNLASAMDQAHKLGFVLGDMNESNQLVHADATITLIDADSWQMRDVARGITYPSLVGKYDFLPPELQGRDLATVRLPCHDAFALAVLAFKITGEGLHPFDGVYLGPGDVPTIEERIASHPFPYRDRSAHWKPRASAVPFEALHPSLQRLFIWTFEVGRHSPSSRPGPKAFQEAFARAESALQLCRRNRCHCYWSEPCLWCQRTKAFGGFDPFPEFNKPRPVKHPIQPSPIRAPALANQPQPRSRASVAPVRPSKPKQLQEVILELAQNIARELGLPYEILLGIIVAGALVAVILAIMLIVALVT
jgi:DNA-binding helix-hairpin-helix protein with protein kinase domain